VSLPAPPATPSHPSAPAVASHLSVASSSRLSSSTGCRPLLLLAATHTASESRLQLRPPHQRRVLPSTPSPPRPDAALLPQASAGSPPSATATRAVHDPLRSSPLPQVPYLQAHSQTSARSNRGLLTAAIPTSLRQHPTTPQSSPRSNGEQLTAAILSLRRRCHPCLSNPRHCHRLRDPNLRANVFAFQSRQNSPPPSPWRRRHPCLPAGPHRPCVDDQRIAPPYTTYDDDPS
jgi:hypothetical protein